MQGLALSLTAVFVFVGGASGIIFAHGLAAGLGVFEAAGGVGSFQLFLGRMLDFFQLRINAVGGLQGHPGMIWPSGALLVVLLRRERRFWKRTK